MKAALTTLGCKVNSYDTAMMAQLLKDAGYEIVDFNESADVYVINSCTVTGTGDKKSRQMVGRAKKTNPDAVICMAGCMAQVAAEEIKSLGVDLILGTRQKSRIVELVDRAKSEFVMAVSDEATDYEDCFKTFQEDRTRGFLKIQDGCSRFCTYCIIPYARGRSTSRYMSSIIREAKELVKSGYKELVLTGIHIASYGKDFKEKQTLLDVICEVAKIDGVERIRLGSLEPMILTKDFCEGLKAIDKLCPSFHISMQSGCNKTLKAMGRRYTAEEFYEYVCNVRECFPDCNITTDIIVGFPGETEEDFNECVDFVKKVRFGKCHVFPFSARKGTPAAKMKDQIQKAVKHDRAKAMIEICSELEREYIGTQLGKKATVLFETEVEKGMFCGYTKTYIKAFAKGNDLGGKIKEVKINDVFKDGVMAEYF